MPNRSVSSARESSVRSNVASATAALLQVGSIAPLRSYRAHLVPKGTPLEQVEVLACAGGLTQLRLRAPNCAVAQVHAHRVTGLQVHSVERVETAGA